MSILDYRGFRLMALSVLPINRSTIQYGSNDAGRYFIFFGLFLNYLKRYVHADNAVLNKKMELVAKRLNLKKHQSGNNNQWVHMPGDVEGHLGSDGNFYVIGAVFI